MTLVRRRLKRWLVVQAHPRREEWAVENVLNQQRDVLVYLPKTVDMEVTRGRLVERTRCLFPGYFFVLSRSGQYSFLHSTFGVKGLLMLGDTPGTVSGQEIVNLMAREDAEGQVVLPNAERLQPGMQVRATAGVFEGQVGIVQGMAAHQRCRVLMEMLGGQRKVLIAAKDLEQER